MMPFPFSKTRLGLALLLAGLSGSLQAAHSPSQKEINQTIEFQRVSRITQQVERSKIIENTQNTFTLLGAEIALERGQPELALNTYVNVLRKTKNPEVAERAMELAVNLYQYALAEEIYALWQEVQPESSPAQRRIAWARALALGDATQTFEQLPAIVSEADDGQIRRIFLMLSQVSLQNPDMVRAGGKLVHDLAWRYQSLPEAMITEIIYSAGNRETKQTLNALKQLSEIDKDLSYASRLALSVLVREQPEILSKFFDKYDSKNLSETWQELEIENLIQAKQFQAAQSRLNQLLENQPNTNLYFLAASQAYQHNKNSPEALIFLEKAYQHGSPLQKSRAASMLALNLLGDKKVDEAQVWLSRITSSEFLFDKHVLEMYVAHEKKDWQSVLRLYSQNRSLSPNMQHRIFTETQREQIYLEALSKTRQPHMVLAELNRMLRLAEKNHDNQRISVLLYQRGILYSDKLNRVKEAVADLRRYLLLNPESASAQNALGYTLLSLPESVDEGMELIKKAYQKEPENAAINDSMGWAYFLKGDYETAKLYLEYAYQHMPDTADVAAHLGELYWKLGQHDKAQTVWREGWLKDKNNAVLKDTLLKYKIIFVN